MENLFLQTSLIAAFVAGMVALFAPCCITFLLPAYLGSVFKEKGEVLLMTLVFGAGIFVTLFPAVLGVALISQALFRYHNIIYILGGVVMLLVAITTFFGIKMPMPNLPQSNTQGRTDILSIFIMGIFSGITSACCAPVLIGILTLTFLSPNFFGAFLIGGMYVLGMVTPLLLMAAFLGDKISRLNILRKPVMVLTLAGKSYPIILSNLIASLIFVITGVAALIFTATGKLSAENMDQFTRVIQNAGNSVNTVVGGNLLVNLVFVAVVILFIYWISKKV